MAPTPLSPAVVAYVMTHYPRVALTFIADEIDAVEARGLAILPMAMNAPLPADMASPDAEKRRRRTVYLKRSWARAVLMLALQLARHPVQASRLVARALMSAGLDAGLAARRLSHLLQAAVAADVCARQGIRHVHAQFGLGPATVAWFATEILNFDRKRDARWSFTIHGFQDFVDEQVARLDLKARTADFIVCISDFTRSQLWRVADPRDWSKARVVRCGIAIPRFQVRPEPVSPTPVILTVGRLSPEKGQIVLLEACAILARHEVPFQLRIVGDGPFRGALEMERDRLGLADHVHFVGERPPEAVRSELAGATLFCLPSFSEGLPISIMEAMACGVPVIASHIAGIPELVANGRTGLTVPPADPGSLADAMRTLLTDAELRRTISQAAREEVSARHDLERSADTMAALFEESLSRCAGQDVR